MKRSTLVVMLIAAAVLFIIVGCSSENSSTGPAADVLPAAGAYRYEREQMPLEFDVIGAVLGAYSGRLIIARVGEDPALGTVLFGRWEVNGYETLTREDGSEYVGFEQTLADGSKEWLLWATTKFTWLISHKCRWRAPTDPGCGSFGRHAWVNQFGNVESRNFRFTLVRE